MPQGADTGTRAQPWLCCCLPLRSQIKRLAVPLRDEMEKETIPHTHTVFAHILAGPAGITASQVISSKGHAAREKVWIRVRAVCMSLLSESKYV